MIENYADFLPNFEQLQELEKKLQSHLDLHRMLTSGTANRGSIEFVFATEEVKNDLVKFCTLEELKSVPDSTAVAMCTEGILESLKNILLAIWRWLADASKKIVRFIKTFLNPKYDTLDEKLTAYLGTIKQYATVDELNVSIKALPFDTLATRVDFVHDLMINLFNEYNISNRKFVDVEPDNIEKIDIREMSKVVKTLCSKNENKSIGYRVIDNDRSFSLIIPPIQHQQINNVIKTKWFDINEIETLKIKVLSLKAFAVNWVGIDQQIRQMQDIMLEYLATDDYKNSEVYLNNSRALMILLGCSIPFQTECTALGNELEQTTEKVLAAVDAAIAENRKQVDAENANR